MDFQPEALLQAVRALGAEAAAFLPVGEIPFDLSFREMCRSNACGMYGQCWMCPPDVGEAPDLIARARSYDQVLVYQTISSLEDSFDIEGMLAAGERQNRLARDIRVLLQERGVSGFLQLGAGGCRRCAVCAKRTGEACRFPEEAMASLEGYCIDVSRLAGLCGMRYINGVNTVTYFGAVLLGKPGN